MFYWILHIYESLEIVLFSQITCKWLIKFIVTTKSNLILHIMDIHHVFCSIYWGCWNILIKNQQFDFSTNYEIIIWWYNIFDDNDNEYFIDKNGLEFKKKISKLFLYFFTIRAYYHKLKVSSFIFYILLHIFVTRSMFRFSMLTENFSFVFYLGFVYFSKFFACQWNPYLFLEDEW